MMLEHLKEIENLIEELELTDKEIKFRKKTYAFSSDNKEQVLTNLLYNECYSKKTLYQKNETALPIETLAEDASFIQALSDHNFTTSYIDYEWAIKKILQNNSIEIVKDGATKIIPVSMCVNAMHPLQINASVNVRQPKEDAALQPGFYYAYSNQPFSFTQTAVRVYWNITSEGIQTLLAAITKTLNQYRIPFIFKCLNNPSLYTRRDSAVLYLDIKYYNIFKWLLPDLYEAVKTYLQPDVPLFTYKYFDGIGIAEHPANNESFGIKMMKIISSAMIKAYNDKTVNPSDKLTEIQTAFVKEELDFNNPFLNRGSKNNLTKDESE